MSTDQRWGRMINRWHDEMRVVHLLKDDGSPACGASYFASSGVASDPPESAKCRNCVRIANKRPRRRKTPKSRLEHHFRRESES